MMLRITPFGTDGRRSHAGALQVRYKGQGARLAEVKDFPRTIALECH